MLIFLKLSLSSLRYSSGSRHRYHTARVKAHEILLYILCL